ncbi:hypothetical protein [Stenotrophomonas sp. B1-1]|uniref:hypothetical protein n=1 Tax=Stenotrophomonas sp. B1-1 TaxID=2710648 RepID=UPI0013DCF6A4|nr:hypothetical protein [Stenotrophomonas sp. B1-1]
MSAKNSAMRTRIYRAQQTLDQAIREDKRARLQDSFVRVLEDPASNPARYSGLTHDAEKIAQDIFQEKLARIDACAAARTLDIERQSAQLETLREQLGPHMRRYTECSMQLSRFAPK